MDVLVMNYIFVDHDGILHNKIIKARIHPKLRHWMKYRMNNEAIYGDISKTSSAVHEFMSVD